MDSWQAAGILALAAGLPLALLLRRQERLLLLWICITTGVNVFDARVGVNLPAARLVGLIVLAFVPLGALHVRRLLRTRPLQLIAVQMLHLIVLGIVFGVLFPWSDAGFVRGVSQSAQGRVIVYMIRILADLGIVLFVARQIHRGLSPVRLMNYVLAGTTLAAVGGLLELVTHVQIYQLVTGYPITIVGGRVRGFNYEPRGLGLAMTHGAFISLLMYAYLRQRRYLWLTLLHAAVLAVSVSASAIIAAGATGLALLIMEERVRRPLALMSGTVAGAIVLTLVAGTQLPIVQTYTANFAQRFSVQDAVDFAVLTPVEVVASFLDIFDYTAFMFLASSPLHALVGTGPGLVMLPGSNFIPTAARWSWVGQSGEGITSLPSMGVLLEIANGGVLGLLLWVAIVASCVRALRRCAVWDPARAAEWRIARGALIVAAAAYAVQLSPLAATWPIFVGVGVGAAALQLVPREQARGALTSLAPLSQA